VGRDDNQILGSVTTRFGTASIDTDERTRMSNSSVRLRRLESILTDHRRFGDAKVLKIDTDGFDAEIVMGAANVRARMRPVVDVEYSPIGSDEVEKSCRRMIECLRDVNYEYFHVFDNFENHMLRLAGSEIDHLRTLNAYVRSSRLDVKPAVYYFDICAMTADDRDISDELLRRYIAGDASDCVARG
jgi:hypothetical protein